MEKNLLSELEKRETFSRGDVQEILACTKGVADYRLQKMLNNREIVRLARNRYALFDDSHMEYDFKYSDLSESVADEILSQYTDLDFRIFELIQLNEFVNHQIAHNVVFVAVEGDLGDFVFQALRKTHPGKVLINPSKEVYHSYVEDDTVVVEKLVSESPRGAAVAWHTRLEKLLVDLLADKPVREAVNKGEYKTIFKDAFARYALDKSTMLRYARRRGAEKKIRQYISDKVEREHVT